MKARVLLEQDPERSSTSAQNETKSTFSGREICQSKARQSKGMFIGHQNFPPAFHWKFFYILSLFSFLFFFSHGRIHSSREKRSISAFNLFIHPGTTLEEEILFIILFYVRKQQQQQQQEEHLAFFVMILMVDRASFQGRKCGTIPRRLTLQRLSRDLSILQLAGSFVILSQKSVSLSLFS